MGKVKHELEDVLRMALIGVLCDCEDCDDISDMVTDREEEFKAAGLLKLGNGVPCGDTILRVVESVNPAQLRASLDCCRGHIIESLCGNQVIIDGKKLRVKIPGVPDATDCISSMRGYLKQKSALPKSRWMARPTNLRFCRPYCPLYGLQGHWFQSTQWGPTVISQNRSCSRAATI